MADKHARLRELAESVMNDDPSVPLTANAQILWVGRAQVLAQGVLDLLREVEAFIKASKGTYVDNMSHPPSRFHYCLLCGTNRDDVPIDQPIKHLESCPCAAQGGRDD